MFSSILNDKIFPKVLHPLASKTKDAINHSNNYNGFAAFKAIEIHKQTCIGRNCLNLDQKIEVFPTDMNIFSIF